MQLFNTPRRRDTKECGDYATLEEVPTGGQFRSSWWKQGGYRRLISLSALIGLVVLTVNLAVLAWGLTKPTSSLGGRVLYNGDCGWTSKASTAIHFLINALATLLLAASNASMQCLTAPTRRDVDAAHAKGKWLHIGVGSVKNFGSIGRLRQCQWLILLLSSLPLHLL
jgi:hypothetical protein